MLKDVQSACVQSGLELHPEKTKVLTTATKRTGRGREKHLDVNGLSVEILATDDSTKYIGRKICFN
eukprot:11743148-Karenia_brevis.AAC.1